MNQLLEPPAVEFAPPETLSPEVTLNIGNSALATELEVPGNDKSEWTVATVEAEFPSAITCRICGVDISTCPHGWDKAPQQDTTTTQP